jgi:multiple sugar transport system permease protein
MLKEKYYYLLPGLIFLSLIFVIPLFYALGITFFKWNLLRPDLGIRFVGFENYIKILSNSFIWKTIGRTFYFVIAAVFTELIIGVSIALFLNRDFFGSRIVSSILLIPFMMAPIVVGFAWRFLLNNDFGPLPAFFQKVGLGFLISPPLLANPNLVLPVLIIVDVWQFTPFVVLVVLAGLKSLPLEPYEAALIDGATPWQQFWKITIPLLKPSLLVAMVIRTLTALRIFDTVMIMTGGGPGSSTEVLSYFGYRLAFQSYEMGKAGTVGFIVMIFALIFTLFYIKTIGAGNED